MLQDCPAKHGEHTQIPSAEHVPCSHTVLLQHMYCKRHMYISRLYHIYTVSQKNNETPYLCR